MWGDEILKAKYPWLLLLYEQPPRLDQLCDPQQQMLVLDSISHMQFAGAAAS